MLQGLETPDHRIHTSAHLLILVQERRTLVRKRFVTLTQRAIFFLQLFHGRGQLCDAGFKSPELVIELICCCISHGETIEPRSSHGQ